MNTQFVLDHLGRVFCFWLVWKFLDLTWHLFDVQSHIDNLAGRRDQHKAMAEVVKTRATKEDQAKLAKGVADTIIGLEVVKKQLASITARQVASSDSQKEAPVYLLWEPVTKKVKRGRRLGVSKLEPIPLADEPGVEKKAKAKKKVESQPHVLKIGMLSQVNQPFARRVTG